MSACDTCVSPGACCKALPLPSLPLEFTVLEVMVLMASYDHSQNWGIGLPFINPRKVMLSRLGRESWVVDCPELRPDGRCGIYEHRPRGPCVLYQPGTDMLCAHHVPKIGLCPDMAAPTQAHIDYKKELQG